MRKFMIFVILLITTAIPVSALELEAPEVPKSGEYYMPEDTDSFGDGVWYVVKSAISVIRPDIQQACSICAGIIVISLLVCVANSAYNNLSAVTELVGVVSVSVLLLKSTNSLIQLGVDTVTELSQYGKLLLPVMTAAVAAQGGTTTSAALYTGTIFFGDLMNTVILKILIPLLYIYICFSVVNRAIKNETLGNFQQCAKKSYSWVLRTILYVFTGYMTITGVVSGTTDAAALKATKLTISGSVPVVGGILSDASEAVIVSVGLLKNAVGVYGLIAIIAVWISPFLKIGIHYLLLEFTASVCDLVGNTRTNELIKDFSGTMGLILAMIGTECLLLMISTVCFMKGVG